MRSSASAGRLADSPARWLPTETGHSRSPRPTDAVGRAPSAALGGEERTWARRISDVSRSPASGRSPPPGWRSDAGNASGMVSGAVIAPAARPAVLPGACYDVTMRPATRPAAPAGANVGVAPRSACLDD